MGSETSKPPAERAPCAVTARVTEEFAQVARALKTLGAENHTLLRSTDEQELLQNMCSVIVESGGFPFAFVTYAIHDQAKSVRWMAGVGNNVELVKSFPFTWADNKAGGTVTGTAIRTGRPVVGSIFRPKTDYAGPEYAKFSRLRPPGRHQLRRRRRRHSSALRIMGEGGRIVSMSSGLAALAGGPGMAD